MSVLSTIKGKIVNVQQDISESLRSFTKVNAWTKSLDAETCYTEDNSASLQLLSRYQGIWMQLHQTSEDLSQRAQSVDGLVTNLFQQTDQQNARLKEFTSEMSGLIQLVSDVNTAKNKIVNLQGAFKELESLLRDFEDVLDETNQLKLREKHEIELQKYQQNKNNELEQAKANLAKIHAEKVRKHEDQLRATLQERQRVFEEAFQEQMMKYITTGQVDCVPSSTISDLAEIEIEQDHEELDRFLGPSEPFVISMGDKTSYNTDSDADNDYEMETIKVLEDEDCNYCSRVGDCQPSQDEDTCAVKIKSSLIIDESSEQKS